ncbi:MAG: mechanosensitive ion channel domain-containing protein [Pseudomonadota bacterium]
MIARIIALAFLAVMFSWQFAYAEVSNLPGTPIKNLRAPAASSPLSDPVAWAGILDTTEQAVSREGVTETDLDRLFVDTGLLRDAAQREVQRLQVQVDQLTTQLKELGTAPEEGQPAESPQVEAQRQSVADNFSKLDAELKRAKLADVRASQLRERIADSRYQRFVQSITGRTKGLTTANFWQKFVTGIDGSYKSLGFLVRDSAAVFAVKIGSDIRVPLSLVFFLIIATLLFLRLRRFIGDRIKSEESVFSVQKSNAAVHGFIKYICNGLLPAVYFFAIYLIFSELDLFTSRLDELLQEAVIAIGFLITVYTLFNVYLSPASGYNRIADIGDNAAVKIYQFLTIGIIIAIGVYILNRTAITLVLPLEVSVGFSVIFALVLGGVGLGALGIDRKDRKQITDGQRRVSSIFWRYLSRIFWLVTLLILASTFTGYIAFAEFLSEQLLFGIVVVLSSWLMLRFIDFVFLQLSAASIASEPEQNQAQSVMGGAGQAIILSNGLLKLLVYVAAGVLLLLPWGYRTDDFFEIFKRLFFGFEIGGLTISVSTVLLAVVLFFLGYWITIALRNWLNNKFLPTTNLDIGISNSISTVFGYTGFLIAAILAISAAGFDLSSLAIVAGALSVGVGFGLQSIVSNFVSGLILLAERPIKAGDWVKTTGAEGYVKKISVRSTEIETFDRSMVIVPNSALITDNVTNWTHGSKSGRIIVNIGVSYDSDPEQVEEILLRCASEHKMVLGRPAPVVYFVEFGASSLDFSLRCFIGDINWMVSVQSALRFSILKELRAANIEIPFPQQDLHLRSSAALSILEKQAKSKT